jgi:CHAD domain-containing protein
VSTIERALSTPDQGHERQPRLLPDDSAAAPPAAESRRQQLSLLFQPAPVAARVLALSYLRRMRQAYRGFAETGDAERLHELRVSVRRLRTLFRAYGTEVKGSVRRKDRRRLRDVATVTAPLRELDVRFAWVDEATLDGEEFLAAERLRARDAEVRYDEVMAVRKQLDKALGKVVRRLRKRLRRYTLELDREAVTALFAVALADTVTRERHQLAERLERAADSDDDGSLHAARMGAKRLRYAIEPVALTAVGAAATAELIRLQDQLGRYLDLGAGVVVLDREVATALREGDAPAVAGLQGLLARARAEREELLERIRADWIADAGRSRLTAADVLVAEVLAVGDLPVRSA